MSVPPPPPPGPPPPPVFKLGSAPAGVGGSGGGQARNALLESIQKGAKLKKTVTVDKSGPAIAGRVAGSSAPTGNSHSSSGSANGERRGGVPGSGGTVGGNGPGGGPKLAGIFGGMSEMPKLKPVNRGANQSTLNRSPPKSTVTVAQDQQNTSISSSSNSNNISSSNSSNNNGNVNGGALDFNAELTQHLTLKKKKQQQQHQPPSPQGNVTEANLKTNRGPPPQPPPAPKNPPAPPPINGIAANSSSLFNNSGGAAPPPPPVKSQPVPRTQTIQVKIITMEDTSSLNNRPNLMVNNASVIPIMGTVPNKSSLFSVQNTNSDPIVNANSIVSSAAAGQHAEESQVTGSVSEMKRLLSAATSKAVPNYGKPNLAPKPPATNGSTPTSPMLSTMTAGGVKATVARHHSMKTPRSPPVAPPTPGGPVFPSQNHFGTMRGPPQIQYQSQETISSSAPVNGRPIGRPTVAPPPRPPPNKPPPPPLRSVSNQNLPQMPLSTPTTNTLNSAASANNVSVLKEQLRHHIGNGAPLGGGGGSTPNVEKVVNGNGNGGAAPPLPPHRTCPAPPPPNASRQASNISTSSSSVPPVPPQRHSSIRSVSVTDSVQLSRPMPATPNGGGGMSTINRIIVDLETKFADRYHNPTEFPKPAPFFRTEKHYPSLTRAKNAAVAESRKQRAPRPPNATRAPAPLPTTTTRQPAPLPPLALAEEEESDKMNDDDQMTTTIVSQQCFIQLTDSKLFANESSNC